MLGYRWDPILPLIVRTPGTPLAMVAKRSDAKVEAKAEAKATQKLIVQMLRS
jgi:hypothetical protein